MLKYIDLALNYSCNMRCNHCFAKQLLKKKESTLSVDEIGKIAEEARSLGCLHFNLQGGEPLQLQNLEDYVRAINPAKMHISITTNGSLYNQSWALRLKKCGVKQIVFSLDYLDAQKHDQFRCYDGAFEKVIASIKQARNEGFSVTVNVTVSHQSLKEPLQIKLFDWLHENRIYYNPILACAVGAWRGNTDCMINDEDVLLIDSLKKTGLAQRDIDASWVKTGCSATAEQIYITPYGDVLPCPFIQISLGSLKQDNLTDIWKKAMKNGWYGHYNNRCWVAQDRAFTEKLTRLYKNHKDLPVPYFSEEGVHFFNDNWK